LIYSIEVKVKIVLKPARDDLCQLDVGFIGLDPIRSEFNLLSQAKICSCLLHKEHCGAKGGIVTLHPTG
jgi:hypothetical protein